MKNTLITLILSLILISCANDIKKPTPEPKSDFSLVKDFSKLTTLISEIDTVKVWANLSLCTYSGMEKLTITRIGDSIHLHSEFAESTTIDAEFTKLNIKVISINDTTWKFNEFLSRNEKRLRYDSVRYGQLQITLNNEKLDFVAKGLSEANKFLADYCITMRNLFPESENYIYGVELISNNLKPRTKENDTIIDFLNIKLSQINSRNYKYSDAINKIKNHFQKIDVPIDSMYIVDINSTSNAEWKFRIIHHKTLQMSVKYDADKKRQDSMSAIGIEDDYIYYIPPVGNWSGYDRKLVYSTINQSIISDLLDK